MQEYPDTLFNWTKNLIYKYTLLSYIILWITLIGTGLDVVIANMTVGQFVDAPEDTIMYVTHTGFLAIVYIFWGKEKDYFNKKGA